MFQKVLIITSRNLTQQTAVSLRPIAHCREISKLGVNVELICIKYINEKFINKQFYMDHSINNGKINIKQIQSLAFTNSSSINKKIFNGLSLTFFSIKFLLNNFITGLSDKLIYSFSYNDLLPLLTLYTFFPNNKPIFKFELAHIPIRKKIFKFILRNCKCCYTETRLLKDKLMIQYPVQRNKIKVLRNSPININEHTPIIEKSKARKFIENRHKFNLPEKIVGFIGTFYQGQKSIEMIINSMNQFDEHVGLLLVGGRTENDVNYFKNYCKKNTYNNIYITGFISPKKLEFYYSATDVMLIYYSDDTELKYWSPVKLSECIVAKKPIVVSEFPEFKEVLTHKKSCYFVPNNDKKLLYNGIKTVLYDEELQDTLIHNISKLSSKFTLKRRVSEILN